jgi:hypothetical protein
MSEPVCSFCQKRAHWSSEIPFEWLDYLIEQRDFAYITVTPSVNTCEDHHTEWVAWRFQSPHEMYDLENKELQKLLDKIILDQLTYEHAPEEVGEWIDPNE